MLECPQCGQSFRESAGVDYLDETYCSSKCAQEAAEEDRNSNEAVESEEE